jgi:hypothetical protein
MYAYHFVQPLMAGNCQYMVNELYDPVCYGSAMRVWWVCILMESKKAAPNVAGQEISQHKMSCLCSYFANRGNGRAITDMLSSPLLRRYSLRPDIRLGSLLLPSNQVECPQFVWTFDICLHLGTIWCEQLSHYHGHSRDRHLQQWGQSGSIDDWCRRSQTHVL